MDVTALIKKIESMKLDQNDKDIMVAELKEKGEDGILDILTLLEMKARNAELAGSAISHATSELAADLEDVAQQAA